MDILPIGKLSANVLQDLLDRYGTTDQRVVVGPGTGMDAAVLDLGDRYLVAKTDPITYATDEIGWYVVHVNANDVACCGATPRWFLVTVLLPEGRTTPVLVEAIFAQIGQACRQLGIAWCGGHTEVVSGLPRPVLVGQMLGEVAPQKYLTTAGAQVGDVVILTKELAIEATAIVAREMQEQLRQSLPNVDLQRCIKLLHDPGISVVREAQLAVEVGGVHALHDPTEGGLATGLWELAQAANVGLLIEQDRIHIMDECQTLCRHFGLDPLGLIASGSLLIAAAEDRVDEMLRRLHADGIAAAEIGRVVPAEQGCFLRLPNQLLRPLPLFPQDEVTRLFAHASDNAEASSIQS